MATLEDIVSAAAKVFRTKGYHAATVRDIAEEVGISKSVVHRLKQRIEEEEAEAEPLAKVA